MATPEKIYFMRVALGVIGGIIAGFAIAPEFDHGTSVAVALAIAVALFGVSIGVSRNMSKGLPKELRKKAGYDGLVPFIFMNIVFMILVYTALHQPPILR